MESRAAVQPGLRCGVNSGLRDVGNTVDADFYCNLPPEGASFIKEKPQILSPPSHIVHLSSKLVETSLTTNVLK